MAVSAGSREHLGSSAAFFKMCLREYLVMAYLGHFSHYISLSVDKKKCLSYDIISISQRIKLSQSLCAQHFQVALKNNLCCAYLWFYDCIPNYYVLVVSWWNVLLMSCRLCHVVYAYFNRVSTCSLSLQAAPPGHHPWGKGLHQNNDRAVKEHRLSQHTKWPETGMWELPENVKKTILIST